MSRSFEVDPARPDESAEAIAAAADAVLAGGLVVLPTETVYGIAARPDDPPATDGLFAAKRRPPTLSLPVLASSAAQAWRLGARSAAAAALAGRFWPGPLTLVLPRTRRSGGWQLGEQAASIGIRVPRHGVAQALLARSGPLAVTSANVSGELPLAAPDAIQDAFGGAVAVFLFLHPDAPRPGGAPSTVVDLSARGGTPRLVREGPVTREDLLAALEGGRLLTKDNR
jgi:tRNA threonylcarbamoyl adenosine modification protein (Sua5/YciO/YrdC/YwlC family)